METGSGREVGHKWKIIKSQAHPRDESGKAVELTRRLAIAAILRGVVEVHARRRSGRSLCRLDTNVVSEPLLQRHEDEIAIPAVVWHELLFGVARLPSSRRRDAIQRYLDEVVLRTMPILDYDRAAAEWHAAERARLVLRGETPPFVDGQIAAIAYVHDLALVTLNASDFRAFHGLRVVGWH